MVTGCKRLVCLVGPSFTSRLWPLVEILAFVWSHDEWADVLEVRPIVARPLEPGAEEPGAEGAGAEGAGAEEPGAAGDGDASMPLLLASLESLDLGSALCTFNEDRQLMLGAIESAFGTVGSLNRQLRSLIADGLVASTRRGGRYAVHRYDDRYDDEKEEEQEEEGEEEEEAEEEAEAEAEQEEEAEEAVEEAEAEEPSL